MSAIAAQPRTLQGYSVAEWQRSGGAFDAFLERGAGAGAAALGIVEGRDDQHAAWLAASQRRALQPERGRSPRTSRGSRNPEAGDWFVVTTIVEDPQYLAQPFITSSNFKKEADGAKWNPQPCKQ